MTKQIEIESKSTDQQSKLTWDSIVKEYGTQCIKNTPKKLLYAVLKKNPYWEFDGFRNTIKYIDESETAIFIEAEYGTCSSIMFYYFIDKKTKRCIREH